MTALVGNLGNITEATLTPPSTPPGTIYTEFFVL
jgi:hypothetical protein